MKHPVTNNGKNNLHIAGQVIRPGTTQMVDEHRIPPNLRRPAAPAAAPAPGPDIVANQAASPARDVIAELADASAERLDAIEANEQAGKARKGVLEAISAERLRRAAAADAQADELIGSLESLTAEQLDEAEAAEAEGEPRERVLQALAAERERRANTAG